MILCEVAGCREGWAEDHGAIDLFALSVANVALLVFCLGCGLA